jgi:hypothetical protein
MSYEKKYLKYKKKYLDLFEQYGGVFKDGIYTFTINEPNKPKLKTIQYKVDEKVIYVDPVTKKTMSAKVTAPDIEYHAYYTLSRFNIRHFRQIMKMQ